MKKVLQHITTILGEEIYQHHSIGGGCIANAQKLTTTSGKHYFMKSGLSDDVFQKEAHGLQELAISQAIAVPKVIAVSNDFLLLEYIEQGTPDTSFFEPFGRELAALHRHTSSRIGFYEDNYIGSTVQINKRSTHKTWTSFYWEERLLFQLRLAEKRGFATHAMIEGFKQLEKRIPELLDCVQEVPSLLHGDLWSGNYMATQQGNPCLIDPAVYYGHRETDLAMTRLFGGFSEEFYQSYNHSFPLQEGHQERLPLYQLYHVMNHINLFGESYYRQAMQIIQQYI